MDSPEAAVSKCLAIPELEVWILDYCCRHHLEEGVRVCLVGFGAELPQDGVLPLRLGSAALWRSVTHRSVEYSQKVLDFVDAVRWQVPDLISYRHHIRVCLAFRAKLLLEMFVRRHCLLDILHSLDNHFPKTLPDDRTATRRDSYKARRCHKQFRELVLLLIRDSHYRKHFLEEEMEQEYGVPFMAAAQRLLWEYLERLERALPQPRIDQLLDCTEDVAQLPPEEQALLSVLNPSSDIPNTLLALIDRIRNHHQQDLSRGGRSRREPGSHTEVQPVSGAQSSVEVDLAGGGRTLGRGTGRQWLRTGGNRPAREGDTGNRPAREGDTGNRPAREGDTGNRPAFSALHFDHSPEETLSLSVLSPPDPFLSQVSRHKTADTEPAPMPGNPRHSQPPSLAAAAGIREPVGRVSEGRRGWSLLRGPLSAQVQEQLMNSPTFQPKVVVSRLTPSGVRPADRPPPSSAPSSWANSSSVLSSSDQTSASSEESSHSDPSDFEYFPYSSQIPLYIKRSWIQERRAAARALLTAST